MLAMKSKLNWPKGDEGGLVHDADWEDPTVSDLAKLLSNGLHTCFHNAVKRIAESGYSEQVAEKVVLRCGPFYGTEDVASNIVDRALTCLRNENNGGNTPRFYMFDDLQKLVDYMMLEMVSMLKEIKPSLSVREAMWTLLMCDLNLIHASEEAIDPLKFSQRGVKVDKGEGKSADTQSQSDHQNQETIASNLKEPDISKPSKPNPRSSRSGRRMEENCPSCRKCCSGNTHKRDALRQKLHFERNHNGRMSKRALKAKLAAWGDMTFDVKECSVDSSSVTMSLAVCSSSAPKLPPQEKAKPAPKPETVAPDPPKAADYYLASIPYDQSKREYVPQDDKDKMIMAAVAVVESLQKELQSWDDWANVKVMEVAKRLGHDRPELNALRAEKAEAERLKNDKQAMEEGTVKRLSETTADLDTANCQIEMANSAVVRLELEKSVIKREMEAAKSRSLLEAKKLEQAMRNEQEALKKCRSFGSEKNLLEGELKVLKRQAAPRHHELDKAKALLTQAQEKLANEERETAKFVKQAESLKNEREQLEAKAKAGDEKAINEVEKEFKKYENEMKRIQYEISAFKLEAETKRIAAMRRGINWQLKHGSSTSQKRDRECVMCLMEEMTVVLLPCWHQVLCAECNVIHEKNGMNECPSCRTPIQKRIAARFAKP